MHSRIVEVAQVMSDPKIAISVASSTAASGVSLWAGWIPDDVGKIAALLGAVLSLVVITTTIATFRCTKRRLELECQKLQQEMDEKKIEAILRRAQGLPVLRRDD
jgi:hypothetical protein